MNPDTFDGLEAAFAELERVLSHLEGWQFDRLEHQHDSSGAWRVRVVYARSHPREILAAYGRRPATAVREVADRLRGRSSARRVQAE